MPTAVIMPKYEMAQETGTVGRWLAAEGAAVAKGDPILEVETDKVTMEVEAPAGGILAGICAGPGAVIPIGQTIAYILAPGEVGAAKKSSPPGGGGLLATPVAARMAAANDVDLAAVAGTGPNGRITRGDVQTHLAHQAQPPAGGGKIAAVPAARRLARELGVDLADVTGSGPEGRIQSDDVRRAAAQQPAPRVSQAQPQAQLQPAEAAPVAPPELPGPARPRKVPLTAIRRTTAERMTASVREIPQFTLSVDADMTRALAILEDLRRAAAADAPKVTITGLLVKACAYALARHPEANAAFGGDHIAQWDEIHIGVAVSGEGGLLVPVVHHADRLGLHAIARRLEDLAARARSGGLRLPDLQGGTFTISNLGMYGVDHFTAIVNPPQAAILAVGRVAPRPVVADDGSLAARPTATLTLTADHRVLDGAGAARFLQTIQAALERPGLLLA